MNLSPNGLALQEGGMLSMTELDGIKGWDRHENTHFGSFWTHMCIHGAALTAFQQRHVVVFCETCVIRF